MVALGSFFDMTGHPNRMLLAAFIGVLLAVKALVEYDKEQGSDDNVNYRQMQDDYEEWKRKK
jgi:hypothetical protein